MSDTKKYYWLKLKRDFFKRHDIKIIESMENGKDYVLFYLKLLLESVDHEGELRFSETVPYNDKMLATITDTNIDIVRSAVKVFSELGMMDRFEDGTLFMSQVNIMLGMETSDAVRMRETREKKKQLLIEHGDSEQCSETFKNRSPELELEKDIELDKEKYNTPDKPVKHKYGEYFHVLLTDKDYQKLLTEWGDVELKRMIKVLDEGMEKKGYKYKNCNLAIRDWKKREDSNESYSKPLIPEKIVPREAKKCPKCGGDIRGSACVECYTNFDYQGNEI